MPGNTMPCAICNEPMWKGRTSKPEGEAAHNACRTAKGKQNQTRQCIDCQTEYVGRDKRCNSCRYARTKANAKAQCTSCDKPATVRGMCITHYTNEYRATHGRKRTEYTKECCFCGTAFSTTTRGTAFCSLECAQRQRAGWSNGKDLMVYTPPTKPTPPVRGSATPSLLPSTVVESSNQTAIAATSAKR